MPESKGRRLSRILILVSVVLLSITLFVFRDRIQKLEAYGYPGIFLVSILANATVIIPLPGILITSMMGAVFNPFWVAIASGAGAALGELSGYMAGYSGQRVIEKAKWHAKVFDWMRKYGGLTILVLAFVPNPAFDVAGITAGALKMPVLRFLLWCMAGKIIKMLIIAYGGAALLNSIF